MYLFNLKQREYVFMSLAVVFVNTKLLRCGLNLIISYKMKTCLVKQTLNEILQLCK